MVRIAHDPVLVPQHLLSFCRRYVARRQLVARHLRRDQVVYDIGH
jgi:hypothetical protein